MKKLGCLLAVFGVLVFGGSFVLFGSSIWRAMEANRVTAVQLEPGKKISSDAFTVDTGKACQIVVRLQVVAAQVEKGTDTEGETDYDAKYKFPFSYQVTDGRGNKIAGSDDPLAWDAGTRSYGDKQLTDAGGTVTVGHHFGKFDVRSPGRVKVEAEIKPDAEFGAELTKAEVELYDKVSRHTRSLVGGTLMLLGGPVLVVLGVIVFLVGLVAGGGRSPRPRR
jgi:hypothetical protein